VKIRTVILFAFLCIGNLVIAQDHFLLDKFEVFEGEGRVFVRCIISSGNTCNGIKVFRGEDTLSLELIGEIPGICGNSSHPVAYEFIDESPILNRKSYYKLELGGYGFTKSRSILLINTESLGFQVRPNPALNLTTLFFENIFFQNVSITLIDGVGREVLNASTKTSRVDLNLYQIAAGTYTFIITYGETGSRLTGKLCVIN
jgi:hypothetical protein